MSELEDSGERQARFGTGSVRDTQEGKPRIDLIPPLFLQRLGVHFAAGSAKYGDYNWQKGQPLSQYYTSAMRHMMAWYEGKEDEDHFAAAMWNVGAAMWTLEEVKAGRLPGYLDDRLLHYEAARLLDMRPTDDAAPDVEDRMIHTCRFGDCTCSYTSPCMAGECRYWQDRGLA